MTRELRLLVEDNDSLENVLDAVKEAYNAEKKKDVNRSRFDAEFTKRSMELLIRLDRLNHDFRSLLSTNPPATTGNALTGVDVRSEDINRGFEDWLGHGLDKS